MKREPGVGDVVKYSKPLPGEESYRFVLQERIGDDVIIQAIDSSAFSSTERICATEICLAETED